MKSYTCNKKEKHRDQATFDAFKKYWDTHPKERFFQALRNWIGCGFLMADGKDTFYFECLVPDRK